MALTSKPKRLLLACVATGMLVSLAQPAVATAATISPNIQQVLNAAPVPAVMASSVVIMDADNGQILYAKNAEERRAPASTTKIMTMYLIMKAVADHKISWTDEVPVTSDAYQIAVTPDVSDAYLDPREHFTLEQMMRFIAVLSANDATVAVADKIGGDKANFVAMMNQEAQALNLKNTHYMNPDGLPQDNHYTTAMDLATLARDLVTTYPDVLKFTSQPTVTIHSPLRKKDMVGHNTDELVGKYPGLDGLKTGYTQDAGYCFVGTAEQNGVRLITVVMGDTKNNIRQRFTDSTKLLDYGFHQFSEATVAQAGQALNQTVPVALGKHTSVAVAAKDKLVVDLPVSVHGTPKLVPDNVQAPVKKGEKVGTLQYVVNGQVVASTDVVATADDPKANFIVRLWRDFTSWIKHLLHKL